MVLLLSVLIILKLDEQLVEVTNVPGTYSLEATSKAEEVALSMLKEGDLVINRWYIRTPKGSNCFLNYWLSEKRCGCGYAAAAWAECAAVGRL